jgi:hypothetical protein
MTRQERENVVRTIKQAAGYVERGNDAAALVLLREAFAQIALKGKVNATFRPAPHQHDG